MSTTYITNVKSTKTMPYTYANANIMINALAATPSKKANIVCDGTMRINYETVYRGDETPRTRDIHFTNALLEVYNEAVNLYIFRRSFTRWDGSTWSSWNGHGPLHNLSSDIQTTMQNIGATYKNVLEIDSSGNITARLRYTDAIEDYIGTRQGSARTQHFTIESTSLILTEFYATFATPSIPDPEPDTSPPASDIEIQTSFSALMQYWNRSNRRRLI